MEERGPCLRPALPTPASTCCAPFLAVLHASFPPYPSRPSCLGISASSSGPVTLQVTPIEITAQAARQPHRLGCKVIVSWNCTISITYDVSAVQHPLLCHQRTLLSLPLYIAVQMPQARLPISVCVTSSATSGVQGASSVEYLVSGISIKDVHGDFFAVRANVTLTILGRHTPPFQPSSDGNAPNSP